MLLQHSVPEYANFDLRIQPAEDGYVATVIDSPEGQANAFFRPAPFEEEIETLLNDLAGNQHGLEGRLQQLGQTLFTAVFCGDVLNLWRASLARSDSAGLGLRLRLRLSAAPALSRWPWESLYDPSAARFVALSTASPIVRYLEAPGAVAEMAAPEPLRLLIVASDPDDLPALAVDQEVERLKRALQPLGDSGQLQVDLLRPVTLDGLQAFLRKRRYHLLHFIGHGEFDDEAREGLLAFEAPGGTHQLVSQRQLSILLSDHRDLRLVVLNACEGGRGATDYAFDGVAQALIRRRMPAVLAMAHAVTDDAALRLAGQFYAALADQYPVDAALTEARKAAFNAGHVLEWATPVLHLRSQDGRLFSPSKRDGEDPPSAEQKKGHSGTVVLDIDNSSISGSSFNINIGDSGQDNQ